MSMGMKCANCGKGVMYGHKVSHAKNRTKRVFAPNLHTARVTIDGVTKRAKICMKCLKKLKKEMVKEKVVTPKVKSPAIEAA